MNTIIEKHKNWMKFYSTASRLLGWLMILSVSVAALSMMRTGGHMTWSVPEQRREFLIILGTIIERTFNWLPVGFILLGIGQLLKYLYADEYKLPWLLRNGTLMLYLFAGLAFVRPFIVWLYQHDMQMNVQVKVITTFCFLLANVLILIGLANILKRVMPIIEEHKSLV